MCSDDASASLSCFREASHDAVPVSSSSPAHQVMETEEFCKVTIDIPGVHKRDLNVSVDTRKHMVQIVGIRKNILGNENDNVAYRKHLEVHDSLHIQDLVMSYSNGVVVLSVPKESEMTSENHMSFLRGTPRVLKQTKWRKHHRW